jgi:hypothetical protein
MFAQLRSLLFGSSDSQSNEVVGDSGAVFEAILERAGDGKRYVVQFQEPELINRGGQFSDDYMARIPTETRPGEPEPPNIEYELPDATDGEQSDSKLFELLDLYDIDTVSDLNELEGETVIGTFDNGFLTLHFDLLDDE